MDAKAIINLGLGKIGSSRVASISPPSSPLERHCAAGYSQWRDSELTKRRWVFSRSFQLLTENTGVTPAQGYDKVYDLPADCLRPIRDKHSTWIVAGKQIHAVSAVMLEFTKRVPEADFDPLFIDALAARCAQETVEFATQSNTKTVNVNQLYDDAIKKAGQANALIIGSEDGTHARELDDWELGRMGIATDG